MEESELNVEEEGEADGEGEKETENAVWTEKHSESSKANTT